jgi:hypothetical protein
LGLVIAFSDYLFYNEIEVKLNVPILRQINAIRTDITLGGSGNAFVIEAEDNELFVCKAHNPPAVDQWVVPNELLATLLGRAIGGPFLEPYLVELDEDVLEISDIRNKFNLNFHYSTLKSGIGFSLKFFEQRRDGTLTDKELARVINPEQSISILLLDSWVHNTDRNNAGNLIFVPDDSKKRQEKFTLYAIDQALAFHGLPWDSDELQESRDHPIVENRLPIIERLARECVIKDKGYLEKALKQVETVTSGDLQHLIEQIPDEWQVTRTQKLKIMDYLLVRQLLLRPLFEQFYGL